MPGIAQLREAEDLAHPNLLHSYTQHTPFTSAGCVIDFHLTWWPSETLLGRARMEDLVTLIDEQNKNDWTSPPPRLAAPECQQDRLPESIQHRNQAAVMPIEPSHDSEPDMPAENFRRDADDTGTARLSMEETIRKYVPDDSELTTSIRQRKSQLWVIGGSEYAWPEKELDFDRVRAWCDMDFTNGGIALLVQDINLDWCKKLCAEYPEALSPQILAEHIIRFNQLPTIHGNPQGIEEDLASLYPNTKIEARRLGNFASIEVRGERAESEMNGFHLDTTIGAPSSDNKEHLRRLLFPHKRSCLRRDVFSRDTSNIWRRVSRRMSCVQLKATLYLVLVDAAPDREPSHDSLLGSYKTPFRKMLLADYDAPGPEAPGPSWLPLNPWHMPTFYNHFLDSIFALFTKHSLQSIFNSQSLPITLLQMDQTTDSRNRMSQLILVWLLAESSWRCTVVVLEDRVQHLRKESTLVAGHQAFDFLIDFRRRLADAQWLLAGTKLEVEGGIKSKHLCWDVNGRILTRKQFWSEKRDEPVAVHLDKAKSIDARDIPSVLKELEGRISKMTETVNEEIQIVIGSVQVEDARVMKRQTEWTVVLAILAAIYLPLTLVTGIFGMNITEISVEATAPDRWSVVRAWVIVFGATMGSIFVYAVVRFLLRHWRIGKLLLKKKMKMIGDGRLYARIFVFKQRIERLWLYRKVHGFRQKMREWDIEAQKMEKMEKME